MNASIPTSEDTFELVEPSKGALYFPSSFITAKCSTILSGCFFTISFMRCDQINTLLCQPLIERITIVGTIPNKSSGSSQGEGFIEGSLDKGDFMWASRSRVHGEWKTMSVSHNHELRTLAPLGLSHFGSPFFATTKVPSIKHSDKSILPDSSKCLASASSILRMTPALTQRLKRRKQVQPEGKRSGKSAHAAPVRSTHQIPLSTARSLCTCGLPRPSSRRGIVGISGANIAHCSSVSSSLLAMIKIPHAKKNNDSLFMK
jgi:hypothetical protein